MSILDIYKQKQTDQMWYDRFQSTGKDADGKFFSCINTNSRSINTYVTQLKAFEKKLGVKRSEWNDYQHNGQEKDKHRIVNLKNAGFIRQDGDIYCLTEKGKEILKMDSDKSLSKKEKWIILFMLIVEYKTQDRDLDLINTVIELINTLANVGVSRDSFMRDLKEACKITKKEDLFHHDIFWLITFYKDQLFIKDYLNASDNERDELKYYVEREVKDIMSADCIGHKFVNSGAYSVNTFVDDINMILSILLIFSLQDNMWTSYLKIVSKLFENCSFDKIETFLANNRELYNDIYQNAFNNAISKINS